jgi:hypothetical protein
MHHYIYPIQDAYISNKSSEINKNFGLDEMLAVGVSQSYARVINNTKTYSFRNEYAAGMQFQNFTGLLTGSFFGTSIVNGTIVGNTNKFTSSYFSGSVSGSITGNETGSSIISSNFSGSLIGFTGSIISTFVNGTVTGSITASCFSVFTGNLTNFSGSATGYFTGNEIKSEQNVSIVNRKYINRSLLKFNLSSISESIVNGSIVNPKFFLKMFVTEARELPVEYKIHVFPVSQSWVQGDGYFSDDGSNEGVSWNWRNKNSGSAWFSPYTTTVITSSTDYINNYSLVSESFTRGGGTWYNVPCSQSFSYESADIKMDVTPIVSSWLNNSIPNEGFIILCSEETNPSGSNAHLFFFSRETNTIYSPYLDVGWDDQVYITGSFGTGSIVSVTYPPGVSGSMLSTSIITGVSANGNVGGNLFLMLDSSDTVLSTSICNLTGQNGTIKGLEIDGYITGSAPINSSGSRYITASIHQGDFSGSTILGVYSSSVFYGTLTGSFVGSLFENHYITGSVPDYYQNSTAAGIVLGYQASNNEVRGIITSGLLRGADVRIFYTGSYAYLTSSYTITTTTITGSSFQLIDSNKSFVTIVQDLKNNYKFGEVPRINIFAREKYPLKTFGKALQQPIYVTPRLLPTSSFYAIKDNETEEFIVDFDNYSKISCDLNGHFFILDTTSFGVERYYKILIKVVFDDGRNYTFDNNNIFKITR